MLRVAELFSYFESSSKSVSFMDHAADEKSIFKR
jgi:hypothetical protein